MCYWIIFVNIWILFIRFVNECDFCYGKIGFDCKDVFIVDDWYWYEMCFMCDLCCKFLCLEGKFIFYKD